MMNKYILMASTVLGLMSSCRSDDSLKNNSKDNQGTGLEKNLPADLKTIKQVDFNDQLFNLPAEFVLDVPPIANQKSTNKCVSFSGSYMIVGFYNGLNSKNTNQSNALGGSPEYTHHLYKQLNADNCGTGAVFFDQYKNGERTKVGMATILKDYGTTSWQSMPFVNNKNCQYLAANLAGEAKSNAIEDFYRLDEDEYSDTEEIKNLIYTGHPVWFAAKVGGIDAFEALAENPNAIWKSGLGEGYHAMVIVGWSDAKKAFKVANSWGTAWGDSGFLWIDYNHMTNLLNDSQQASILYPNKRQQTFFNKLTPVSCGNNNWGYLDVDNSSDMEIKIELEAGSYKEEDLTTIDADTDQSFFGIKAGTITLKVKNAATNAVLDTKTVSISQCETLFIKLNAQGKIM